MEILKHRLSRYKEVYTATEIKEETLDVIVPDCNPDYEREICSYAVARVTDKSMLSGSLRVSGDIRAFTHYDSQASENMYLVNADTKFGYSFDIPSGLPEDTACITVRVLSTVSEVLNSRKIRIKVKIAAEYAVYRMENIELSEDVCGSQGDGINVKTKHVDQTSCIDIAEKRINFTEEIRLSNDEAAQFARIIRWNWKWEKEEMKVLQNKIMVRGTVKVSVFGCATEGVRIESKEYILPFSQVVECKNVCETDDIFIKFANDCCFVHIVEKDDTPCLVCEANTDMHALIYRKSEIKLLLDVYSTQFDTDVRSEKIYISRCDSDFHTDIKCQGKSQAENGVNRILDYSAYTACTYMRGVLKPVFCVTVIYEDGLNCVQTVRMILENTSEVQDEIVLSTATCRVKNLNVYFESATLIADIEAEIIAKIKNSCVYDHIVSCAMDTSKPRQRRVSGNLILRYPEKDETVWEIAKCYGTTVTAIMSANGMDDESAIDSDRLIMIPFVK